MSEADRHRLQLARPERAGFAMSFPRSPAGSPPAPANAALPNPPRKRPSIGPQGPSAKRRKPSTYSIGSTHPLRQTSFPPDGSAALDGPRSPSVETDFAPSVATSFTGGKRRKKHKSTAPEGSVRSGKTGATGQRAESEAKADGDEGEDDEDEEEEGNAEMLENGRRIRDEQSRRFAVLYEAADQDQEGRLTSHRVFHLNDPKLRKIVNQTLSQSVPKTVIQAVSAYSKLFIGELIEKAIEIQRQNMLAAKAYPTPERRIKEEGASQDDADEKEVSIGPLLPDSLREALRRMKRDGEYGGAGFEGYSLGIGLPGAKSAALGGRRLFR